MLMIKPAEPYLDVISYASQNMKIPIAAYQVSESILELWQLTNWGGWTEVVCLGIPDGY